MGALRALFAFLFAFSFLTATSWAKERSFELTYVVNIKSLPATAGKVRLWLPVAQSTTFQKVEIAGFEPEGLKFTKGEKYGNRFAYIEFRPGEVEKVAITYKVSRKEASPYEAGTPASIYLEPSKMAPFTDYVRSLAKKVVGGERDPYKMARKVYDYVVSNVKYDKSGKGWGRGDLLYVCDTMRGNCTDFHTLFITMMRVVGIPARFRIGLPIPKDCKGKVKGYHCWAEFYAGGRWVPVDASEASKNEALREYYFGNLCENRVEFTLGRDLVLVPKQSGPPLNFFIYPYAEVDGKPAKIWETDIRFRNL